MQDAMRDRWYNFANFRQSCRRGRPRGCCRPFEGAELECMDYEDAILNSTVVYSKEEVYAEFQECCEAEAETPGHYTERLRLATEDLCQMLERQMYSSNGRWR